MVDSNELRSEIIRNGFNIKSLSGRMGMSENTLGKKVAGKSAFTVPEVHQLCDILHIDDPMRKVAIFLPDRTH